MIRDAFWEGFNKQASLSSFVKRHGLRSHLSRGEVKGLVKSMDTGPADSLFLWPAKAIGRKIFGEKKMNQWGDKVNRAVAETDAIVGKPLDRAASKFELTKNLFKEEDTIPLGTFLGLGKNRYKKIKRVSALSPVSEASKFAIPMVASSAIYSKIHKDKPGESRPAGEKVQ